MGLDLGTYYLIVSGFSDAHFGAFDLEVEFRPVRAFNEAIFMATHNSYSEDRGSINEQLNQAFASSSWIFMTMTSATSAIINWS